MVTLEKKKFYTFDEINRAFKSPIERLEEIIRSKTEMKGCIINNRVKSDWGNYKGDRDEKTGFLAFRDYSVYNIDRLSEILSIVSSFYEQEGFDVSSTEYEKKERNAFTGVSFGNNKFVYSILARNREEAYFIMLNESDGAYEVDIMNFPSFRRQ